MFYRIGNKEGPLPGDVLVSALVHHLVKAAVFDLETLPSWVADGLKLFRKTFGLARAGRRPRVKLFNFILND